MEPGSAPDSSLGAIAWRRLWRDRNAIAGAVIIGTALLVAALGGLLRSDANPWANRQVLAIRDLPPGSTVQFLKLVRKDTLAPCGPLCMLFFGGCVEPWTMLPVHRVEASSGGVQGEEFNGHNALVPGRAFQVEWSDLVLQPADAPASILGAPGWEERALWSMDFPLGTDSFGRDVLSRLMAGTIISLSVGLIAVLISLLIGIPLGALAGYFRAEAPTFTLFGRTFRWPVDDVIMWLVNVIWSIPTLLLVFAITLALGKGFWQVFVAVGLTLWVNAARIVRGQVMGIRELEYIEAARALGFSHVRTIVRHILPNVLGPVLVVAASNFAVAIVMEAGLSFLGVGVQPPQPSWGLMIKENYNFIITRNPMLAIVPGLAIMTLVLAFNILGNGLRDAMDVRQS